MRSRRKVSISVRDRLLGYALQRALHPHQGNCPPIKRSSVVLPVPLGPMMAVILPRGEIQIQVFKNSALTPDKGHVTHGDVGVGHG